MYAVAENSSYGDGRWGSWKTEGHKGELQRLSLKLDFYPFTDHFLTREKLTYIGELNPKSKTWIKLTNE